MVEHLVLQISISRSYEYEECVVAVIIFSGKEVQAKELHFYCKHIYIQLNDRLDNLLDVRLRIFRLISSEHSATGPETQNIRI